MSCSRRAVGDMIPQPGRKALHRQYGQILLSRGESEVLAASHLLQATDPGSPASLADLDAAAEQTLRSAPQTAADLAGPCARADSSWRSGRAAPRGGGRRGPGRGRRLDQADRVVRDTLAMPVPPVTKARLRCGAVVGPVLRGEAGTPPPKPGWSWPGLTCLTAFATMR